MIWHFKNITSNRWEFKLYLKWEFKGKKIRQIEKNTKCIRKVDLFVCLIGFFILLEIFSLIWRRQSLLLMKDCKF